MTTGTTGSQIKQKAQTLKLMVKAGLKRRISFELEENETVEVLKFNIQERTGYPLSQQRLLFNGKQLDESHSLKYYQVNSPATLDLVLSGSS